MSILALILEVGAPGWAPSPVPTAFLPFSGMQAQ